MLLLTWVSATPEIDSKMLTKLLNPFEQSEHVLYSNINTLIQVICQRTRPVSKMKTNGDVYYGTRGCL